MSDRTPRFGLTILNRESEDFGFEGHRYGVDDRHLIDRVLHYAAEAHRHSADTVSFGQPDAPLLTLGAVGSGQIPAGTDVLYRYALVDNKGHEQAASGIVALHTPSQLRMPKASILSGDSTVGTLRPGTYDYAVSVYTGISHAETPVGPSASLVLDAGGSIELTLPTLEVGAGADGFNIYRRAPLEGEWVFLASTADATYVDDGSVSTTATRNPSGRNTTHGARSVTVALPDALPSGYTWRIYRTYDRTNWVRSLVEWVADASCVDYGMGTTDGSPRAVTGQIAGASLVDMTDMAEVDGYLPPGRAVIPQELTFTMTGELAEGYLPYTWVCEYDQADILATRSTLGIGSVPAADPVIVGLQRLVDGEFMWELLATTVTEIAVGENQSELVDCAVWIDELDHAAGTTYYHLERGDQLRLLVMEAGGGTPTDRDLVMTVLAVVQYGSVDTSYEWSEA